MRWRGATEREAQREASAVAVEEAETGAHRGGAGEESRGSAVHDARAERWSRDATQRGRKGWGVAERGRRTLP